jgi:electron transfer flavoprotein alpha subunit
MKAKDIRKVLILDQGNPVAGQLLQKATEVFGTDGVQYVMLKAHRTHNLVLAMMEETVREEAPELVLLGATALGEEVAPALGVRLGTGVAAHCVDIKVNEEGRLTCMIPAIGGRAVGEIFIPEAEAGRPAIATVKPGIFPQPEDAAFAEEIPGYKVIDIDTMAADGKLDPGEKVQGGFRMTEIVPRERSAGSITGADIIVCGGYGLGSEGVWRKLEMLAQRLGGAAACTRAALDAEWGCAEDSMIGTSGKAVRPKVYIGLGISGAAHHLCGITGADTIISINNDKDAEVFAASDYKGVFDAEQIIDALLEMTE